jgi:hypothetical protein
VTGLELAEASVLNWTAPGRTDAGIPALRVAGIVSAALCLAGILSAALCVAGTVSTALCVDWTARAAPRPVWPVSAESCAACVAACAGRCRWDWCSMLAVTAPMLPTARAAAASLGTPALKMDFAQPRREARSRPSLRASSRPSRSSRANLRRARKSSVSTADSLSPSSLAISA